MNNKSDKPDAHEFRVQLKNNLSIPKKASVIQAIKTAPKFSRYYHLQENDWYQLREKDNQDLANPPNIEILLKNDHLLVMRPVDDKPWWTDLDQLKGIIQDDILEVTVTVENYWE